MEPKRSVKKVSQFSKKKDYSGLDLVEGNEDGAKWLHLRYVMESKKDARPSCAIISPLAEAHTGDSCQEVTIIRKGIQHINAAAPPICMGQPQGPSGNNSSCFFV